MSYRRGMINPIIRWGFTASYKRMMKTLNKMEFEVKDSVVWQKYFTATTNSIVLKGELCIWGLKKDIMILLIPLDDLSLVIPSKDGFRAVREFSVARDANINLSSLANAFLISRQQILCTLG
ncbi:hypothetical protein DAI22_11g121600 [Oryza sativa Japonica Group]|nr:hypothetical protein DAI22_11g121600 [Oryza sativa Japonica Group]